MIELVQTKKQPFTSAHISLCVAEQGDGKSTLLTARVVDATFKNLTSVKLNVGTDEEYEVKASPALNPRGFPIIGYATFLFPNKKPLVAKVPPNSCIIAQSIRIFANYNLYGIKSMKCDLADILNFINDPLFLDGYMLVDEGYIGADSRNSMSLLNQIITALEFSLRKRRMYFMIAYPLNKMSDLRFRLARTEYITCTYNEKTFEVTAEIKKNKEKKKKVTIFTPIYWKYFKTEERFAIPQSKLNRAMKDAY